MEAEEPKKVDWNNYSSDSDDSWLKSDDEQSNENNTVTQKQTKNQTPTNPTNSEKTNPPTNTQIQKKQTTQQINKQPKNPTQSYKKDERTKPKYLTDQQILKQYQSDQKGYDKTIKVLRITKQLEQQVLAKNQNIRSKNQMKEGYFIVNFNSKESLIKFIEEKISKKYRFRLGLFFNVEKNNAVDQKKQKRKYREEKQSYKNKDKEPHRDKQHYKEKQHYKDKEHHRDKEHYKEKQHYRQKDREYHKGKDREYREKKQYQNKQQKQYRQHKPRHNEDYKKNKDYNRKTQEEDNFIIEKQQNHITILNDQGSIDRLKNKIKQKKLNDDFTKIYIAIEAKYLNYAEEILSMFWKQYKFGLINKIDEADYIGKPDTKIEFVLQEKKEPIKICRVLPQLGVNINADSYFTKCSQNNEYILGSKYDMSREFEFSDKQYFEQFKKNYDKISQKWNSWIIKAYQSNISKLLKLSSIFTKGLPNHAVKLSIGEQQNRPYTILSISRLSQELPKSRKKPDTSAVYSHLNA